MPKASPQVEEEFSQEELEQLGQANPPNEPTDEELHAADDDDAEDQRPDEDEGEGEGEEAKEGEGQPEKGKSKMVNHGAFHKERVLRKQLQGERDSLLQRNNTLEQRLNIILERLQAPQQEEQAPPQEEQAPDPETDPVGYIKWQQKKIDDLAAKVTGREKAEQQMTQQQQILQQGTSMALEVRNQNPDLYDSSLKFVMDQRSNQLRAMGMDNATIEQTVQQELTNGMMYALNRRINPGKFLLDFAKSSGFVYQPKQGDDPIQELEQKVKSNKTLGNSPKHGRTGQITAADINDMTDEEFNDFYSKVGKKGFAKTFGS